MTLTRSAWGTCQMTKMLLKPHNMSSYMQYARISAEGWNRLISSPRVAESKDDAPLLIWGSMTETVELDPVSQKPRCTGDNIEKLFAFQIDVDGGYPIESFVRDYHRYAYQLYTSHSHTFKPGGDRYRVILPLKEPLYLRWFCPPVKQVFHDLFDMVDVSCFDKGHWQLIPIVRSKDAPYVYMQHQGEKLSFDCKKLSKMAADYYDAAHWKREIAEADRDPNANHSGALKFVQEVFDKTSEGSRNRTVYAKLMWLRETVGCTYNEVLSLTPPAGFDDEYIKIANRIFG